MRLRWTEPAVQDLQNICDYINEHDGPAAARRIALKIFQGLDSLVEFPRRGLRIRGESIEVSRILLGHSASHDRDGEFAIMGFPCAIC